MKEVRVLFDDLATDPLETAVGAAHWWLVNRIRSRADAEEVLKIARQCLAASGAGSGQAMRQALDLVGDAVQTWDVPDMTPAERLGAWINLASLLNQAAGKSPAPQRRAAIELARLLLLALGEAYRIQKEGNRAAESWRPATPTRRGRPAAPPSDEAESTGGPC